MKREQVKEKHKWSIEDIFTSDEEWEKSFEKLSNSIVRPEAKTTQLSSYFKLPASANLPFQLTAHLSFC